MLPVIVIIGRPNVGKSSLFNYLTKSRDALVMDQPGVTRDRLYGHGQYDGRDFIVVDTGGIGEDKRVIDQLTEEQALLAVAEADVVIFLVDARGGLTSVDQAIYQQCRESSKTLFIAANKVDGLNEDIAIADFYRLGATKIYPTSITHNYGVRSLLSDIFETIPASERPPENPGIKFAIIGKPNVGKSTLVNRILGEERVITLDEPGTTRDSIYIPFTRRDKEYTVIDTAGIRRRKNVTETIEKFSVIKTLKAISEAHVVVTLFDAQDDISHQDLLLLGFALHEGRAVVVGINKWDGLPHDQRAWIKKEIDRKLNFINFARMHFISALHGTGVGELFDSIDEAYASATKEISTSELNRALEAALKTHQPPMVAGRRIKLRYAHIGAHNPPTIIVHGNRVDSLPESYKRYLMNFFRKTFKLVGTPVRLFCEQGENPFKDKKNVLTERQVKKRRRLKKFIKKNK